MSFYEEHLDDHYLCQREVAERDERIRELVSDVSEWACDTCNFVYPGPPQPGLMCVICPRCNGSTMPYATLKLRKAETRIHELEAALLESRKKEAA